MTYKSALELIHEDQARQEENRRVTDKKVDRMSVSDAGIDIAEQIQILLNEKSTQIKALEDKDSAAFIRSIKRDNAARVKLQYFGVPVELVL